MTTVATATQACQRLSYQEVVMRPAFLRFMLPLAVLLPACGESSDRLTEPRDLEP
jgi:hypothetical protein